MRPGPDWVDRWWASASSLTKADEKTWNLLCAKFGDGAAVLKYCIPPEVPEAQFALRHGLPSLIIVAGNSRVGTLVNAGELHPEDVGAG